MLHILLLILKIILIILAILIGVILLSLCIALFVPVHYKVELNRTEEEGSPPIEVDAKITWLLHFINIRAVYPSDIYLKVRVMFITLFRLPMKEKKPEKEKTARQEKKQDKTPENEADAEEGSSVVNETVTEEETDVRDKADKTDKTGTDDEPGAAHADDGGAETERIQKDKPSLIDKIKNIFKKIFYTIKGICAKIKEILENVEYYLNIIKRDEFKNAFSLCKGELGSILDYIKPRKFQADLIIGLDDPAATGQILSYCGILYPLIGNNVTVTGDFERKRIEGSVFIKGKIKLFTFLKAVIRIYFNKDIKKLLKLFNKEEV